MQWTRWVFVLTCYITCASSFLGPIIVGSVLVNNTFACSDENFDLLLDAARWVFIYNEMLTAIMCYSLTVALLLLPFVVQNSIISGFVMATCFAGGVCFTLRRLVSTSSPPSPSTAGSSPKPSARTRYGRGTSDRDGAVRTPTRTHR
jgi:hypothetical protein